MVSVEMVVAELDLAYAELRRRLAEIDRVEADHPLRRSRLRRQAVFAEAARWERRALFYGETEEKAALAAAEFRRGVAW